MQERVNEETKAIIIKAVKLTTPKFKDALKILLKKSYETGKRAAIGERTSLKKLGINDQSLKNIEITDGNIKSFEKTAKKYHMKYALKKDVKTNPPTYYVFFKAKDLDVMDLAFKDYLGKELTKDLPKLDAEKDQPSVKQELGKMKEKSKALANDKVKNKVKNERSL